jgi:hypothetical protein
MIVDEILYEERYFRERYRLENPKTLRITKSNYDDLCIELDVDDLDYFHGMEIIVTDDVDTFEILPGDSNFDEDEEF